MRRSPRLRSFDYTTAGAYFVTAVTHNRARVFGELSGTADTIIVNDAGEMIQRWWNQVPQKFPSVTLDAHVVMPDHLHAVVVLQCSSDRAHVPVSLPRVMQWFKTMTSADYFRRVKSDRWPRVEKRLWQRSYYDHVIRGEDDLIEIRTYIESNPGALFERYAGRTRWSAPTPT